MKLVTSLQYKPTRKDRDLETRLSNLVVSMNKELCKETRHRLCQAHMRLHCQRSPAMVQHLEAQLGFWRPTTVSASPQVA